MNKLMFFLGLLFVDLAASESESASSPAPPDWRYEGLISIGASDFPGEGPREMTEGSDGLLYGTTAKGGPAGGGVLYAFDKSSLAVTILRQFPGAAGDGSRLFNGVIEGRDGFLYGITHQGGAFSRGTIFRIRRSGSDYQVLHHFGSEAGPDGRAPRGLLVQGSEGRLYGTTPYGGTADKGTVFRMNSNGSGYQILHHFTGPSRDGREAWAGLVVGQDGVLYGTTQFGGPSTESGYYVGGTLYKIEKDGRNYAVFHNFLTEAKCPDAGLIEGRDGALYGMTLLGGTFAAGTVFRCSKDGLGFQVLHSFTGADGALPRAPLLEAKDGWLYGPAREGGRFDCGTLFQLQKEGTRFRLLYEFTGIGGDGRGPGTALLQASDGAIYGTTVAGGNYARGTIFRLVPAGTAPVLVTQPVGVTLTQGMSHVLSVTATGTPSLSFQWQLNDHNLPGATNQDLALDKVSQAQAGDYRVVVSNGYGTVISSPASLTVVALLTRLGACDIPGYALNLVVLDSYAYVAAEEGGLQIIDVQDPTQPVRVGSYRDCFAMDVAVAGSDAYVAAFDDGLRVIDIRNPAHPLLVGACPTPGLAGGVAVAGDYAYVADWNAGLQIVDVHDPAHPVLVGTYPTLGWAYDVVVAGTYAYVTDDLSGLRVVDVSTPPSPIGAGSLAIPGVALNLALADSRVYVTDYEAAVHGIDMQDPRRPQLVSSYPTDGNTWGVAVTGSYVWVANWATGLGVLDLRNPDRPAWVGRYDLAGGASAVVVVGDQVYVAAGESGFLVLDNPFSEALPFLSRPQEAGVGVAAPVVFTLTSRSGGEPGLELTLQGEPGASYGIESSTDLHTWTLWQTVSSGNSVITLPVPTTQQCQACFYRMVKE